MTHNDFLTLGGLALMSLAHLAGGRVAKLPAARTRSWISFGAGASVSYVFIHVFPEIGVFQRQFMGLAGGDHHSSVFFNQPLYSAALAGLCLVYLLNTAEAGFFDEESNELQRHRYYMSLFAIKLFLYFLYNSMFAYLITQRPGEGFVNITLIVLAMTLHFMVVDIRFHEVYGDLYERYIRWITAAGLLLGWVLGVLIDLPDAATMTAFSLIGGMITYVALKNELPQTRHKAPLHFLAGVFIFAFIVLAIPYFGLSGITNH